VFVMGNMGDIRKEKAMKPVLKRIGLMGFLAVLFLRLVILSAEAGQKEKISATKKYGPIISRSIIYPGDLPKHEILPDFLRLSAAACSSE